MSKFILNTSLGNYIVIKDKLTAVVILDDLKSNIKFEESSNAGFYNLERDRRVISVFKEFQLSDFEDENGAAISELWFRENTGKSSAGLSAVPTQYVDEYSLTETLTNKTYLGKPVYRKVIKDVLEATPITSLNVGSLNIEKLTSKTILIDGGYGAYVSNHVFNEYSKINVVSVDNDIYGHNNIIKIHHYLKNSDGVETAILTGKNYELTLEYTKTTD